MRKESDFFGFEYDDSKITNIPTFKSKVSAVIEIMRPKPSPFAFVRLGGSGDGAYLLPDDLGNIKACFSPGVNNRKHFEDILTEEYGIACHMCDYSSDEHKLLTPLIAGKQTFDKLWLEPYDSVDSTSIETWVNKFYPEKVGDFLLQIDIEGAEYRNILSTSLETLSRFRIIAIEVHGLEEINSGPVFNSVIYPFFEKIGSLFTCIHIHPNNNSHDFEILDTNIDLADVVELTFIRTDVFLDKKATNPHTVLIPHPLDVTNDSNQRPLALGEFWCGGTRPTESRLKIIDDELQYEKLNAALFRTAATNSIAEAFRAAVSTTKLKCMSFINTKDKENSLQFPYEEVALGRPFTLSSLYSGLKSSKTIAPSHDYFFHTKIGWDQYIIIDLGEIRRIEKIVIVNRADACFDRASILYVDLSVISDFSENIERFYLDIPAGFTNGAEINLVVPIPSVPACYLKICSPVFTALHFSDIRVYASNLIG